MRWRAAFSLVGVACTLLAGGLTRADPPTSGVDGDKTLQAATPRDLRSLLRLQGDADAAQDLTIESESLELETLPDQGRLLTFVGDVRVHQGVLEMRADHLEAYYPPQEAEPSRLIARGGVQVDQPGQRAHCAEAEYSREQDRLVCRGQAKLVQGCDVVAGESIEFDLTSNRVRVIGAARVVIAPRQPAGDCVAESPAAEELP